MQGRPITLAGKALAFPAVCAPLVGRTSEALVAECTEVAARNPDLIEWRVDFFEGIGDAALVVDVAARLRAAAGPVPILFTRRSAREGGEPIGAEEAVVLDVYRAVCESGHVDMIDFEMDNEPSHVERVREMSKAAGLALVLSFHDFAKTPAAEELVLRFERAQALGADVAKIAVMPRSRGDVIALLQATERASSRLAIPVVSMSMGPLGAVTRACGWLFGSAMTFAVGRSSSAPGQMAIGDVRAVIDTLRRSSGMG